jgi:hypothetical protein
MDKNDQSSYDDVSKAMHGAGNKLLLGHSSTCARPQQGNDYLSDVSCVLLWNQAQAATRNEATSSFSPSKMALQERYKSGWYVAERQRITV